MKGKNEARTAVAISDSLEAEESVQYGFLRSNFPFSIRLLRGFVRRESQRIFDEVGILPGDASVVAILALNPGITQTKLCDALLLKKSQLTVTLRGMTEQGLVIRKESAADRRINTLKLTKRGEKLWDELRRRVDQHNELILSPLSNAEQKTLYELFDKIIDGFETRSMPGEVVALYNDYGQ
ncbi:MarR family winged helix-turn-helix transcriptional regulator [Caballeronia sp. ATUFL_M2_KS44]|uniref:MarR family winged helix-turn-helix transcriptional regulator n=1 Tax=Caballeronia sp. ATUFL_M2_KS44 TaxID=2921767 RepID=UPI002027D611|nr:MarR family winged helix-turn-helix transcriptional regulator [Caballeronia sp. ATUFL_M2_KS44]